MKATTEQRELMLDNLTRYFSESDIVGMILDHEQDCRALIVELIVSNNDKDKLANFYLDCLSDDEVDLYLESLCSCNKCRHCGTDNEDCVSCEVTGKPCRCDN